MNATKALAVQRSAVQSLQKQAPDTMSSSARDREERGRALAAKFINTPVRVHGVPHGSGVRILAALTDDSGVELAES